MKATLDLLGLAPDIAPKDIAELHAGPAMTAWLVQQFPKAEIVTLDPMRMERGASKVRTKFDLIVSNGDLELLPSLRRLLPKLAMQLKKGGCLAVQSPNNLYEPNRALLRMIAADGPWANRLLPVAKTRPFNETLEGLYALLRPLCASVDIWETTYLYAMDGVAAIVDFMKATSLAPFLRPLDEASRKKFVDCYVTELARAYPTQPDGTVLLRFPRIFVLAWR